MILWDSFPKGRREFEGQDQSFTMGQGSMLSHTENSESEHMCHIGELDDLVKTGENTFYTAGV